MTVTPQRDGGPSTPTRVPGGGASGGSGRGSRGQVLPPSGGAQASRPGGAAPGGAGPSRLPGPRSDRRPALAALAVLLVLGGALVSGLVAYRSGQRSDFLVLARDLAPGQRITQDDLGVARLAGTNARAVPASREASVVGQYATIGGFAGMLLTGEMVEPARSVPPGAAVVGVAVDPGQVPAGGVRVGDVVRVLGIPARGEQGRPSVLVDAARVSAVSGETRDDGGVASVPAAGGATVVSVVVPSARAAEIAAASAQRQGALVLLPRATRPTVER